MRCQTTRVILRVAAAVVAGLLAGSCLAATRKPAAKPAPEPADDLTVAAARHAAICPPPKLGACVIRKPVASGYRILTPGVEIDDRGDHWIADFAKAKDASAAKARLRLVGSNGDLHEILVTFGEGAAPGAIRPKK